MDKSCVLSLARSQKPSLIRSTLSSVQYYILIPDHRRGSVEKAVGIVVVLFSHLSRCHTDARDHSLEDNLAWRVSGGGDHSDRSAEVFSEQISGR